MDESIGHFVALLAVAMLVAIAARRLKLPYTVGLVVVGAALKFSRLDLGEHLTHDLVFDLILPPLLFEAALALSWRDLKRDLVPILVFSTVGALAATFFVAEGMTLLLGWPFASALVFGALIAATDPVATIAMFKDNALHGRLRLLVESESLMNDGAAAVIFVASLAWAGAGAAASADGSSVLSLAGVAVGGLAIGCLCGGLAILVAGRTSEHLVEAALTTITAFGAFLSAEYFHASGVLATVAAGLVMGNLGVLADDEKSYLTNRGREFAVPLWEFIAFLANSVVFLLIGVDLASMPFGAGEAFAIFVAIGVVLLGRAVTIYPLSLLLAPTRWAIPLREQHILWWGGLRGALALALALSLPENLPLRDELRIAAFGVVGFSIVVQGLTMPPLLRRLGLVTSR
ncbi:cation:proton antiporter [Methylocystis bryophila]|uniref:Sodium:proton exchanger n=1 Tax=Methylocystis bryophila TaxID=655015 RepID=A0A1W6MQX8_9HYPH|nr:sodium:proton antiporter [Methylocystis bryophila]ARN79975.1 sodium:proton exchanger [Methylocystis bryophila]BDV39880.1 sodium/hydrogen exchanger [Methylocystis bryophila]